MSYDYDDHYENPYENYVEIKDLPDTEVMEIQLKRAWEALFVTGDPDALGIALDELSSSIAKLPYSRDLGLKWGEFALKKINNDK